MLYDFETGAEGYQYDTSIMNDQFLLHVFKDSGGRFSTKMIAAFLSILVDWSTEIA